MDPLGLSGLPREVRISDIVLSKYVFQLYINSAIEIKVLNMWTNTCVQLLGKFDLVSQIYMNLPKVPTP